MNNEIIAIFDRMESYGPDAIKLAATFPEEYREWGRQVEAGKRTWHARANERQTSVIEGEMGCVYVHVAIPIFTQESVDRLMDFDEDTLAFDFKGWAIRLLQEQNHPWVTWEFGATLPQP